MYPYILSIRNQYLKIFLILILNSNNESLDFTSAERLLHMREPQK